MSKHAKIKFKRTISKEADWTSAEVKVKSHSNLTRFFFHEASIIIIMMMMMMMVVVVVVMMMMILISSSG